MWRSVGHTAVFGGLVAVTVAAALAFSSFDARLGSGAWADPELPSQWAASWRLGAVFAYTSGSVVGHICALFAGYFGARWSSQRDGVLAGLAIGVANVAASACLAVPATHDSGTMAGNVRYVDPNPLLQPAVLVAVAAVLAGAVIMATYGSGIARLSRLHWLALIPLVIVVPIVHFLATTALAGSPDLLGWDVS